jgi:hypothetical protein
VLALAANRNWSQEMRTSYTISGRLPPSVLSKSLNSNVIESDAEKSGGVWDNLSQTVRKLLILKRRDVRVVEGARLEIALTVCDGVLQISITVTDPEA